MKDVTVGVQRLLVETMCSYLRCEFGRVLNQLGPQFQNLYNKVKNMNHKELL